ncbi:phosphatase PAP2 family protein [Winogradskyella sp. PC D3.3]
MGGTVNILKTTGNVKRPDGSSKNSFPSGHTATAFMRAKFLYQEYKEVSIW